MKRLLVLLTLIPALVHAQYIGPIYRPGNVAITGGTINGAAIGGTTPAAVTGTAIVGTTFNGNTLTTGTGVLTLGAGKTATVSNTLTFTGTDSSSVAFGAGGTVAYIQTGTFTPSFTGLTVVEGGGSVAYSGQYTVIGDVVHWTARVQPSGGATTESTAGTTFITNMPFAIGAIESTCSAVNAGTVASYGNGIGGSSTDNMFTPTWPAVSNGIIISGTYFR